MTDAVVGYVRSAIEKGSMSPDQWYSAYGLSKELGVSRSPVREGLLKLAEAKVIRISKNRGFQVIPTTPEDVAEIFCIRASLEIPAAGRAARAGDDALVQRILSLRKDMDAAADEGDDTLFFQRDQELHAALLQAAGLNRAKEVVDTLRVSTRLLGASTSRGLRTLEDISAEHEPIIQAVLDQDAGAARLAMEHHLEATGRLLVQQAMDRAGGQPGRDASALWADLTEGFYPHPDVPGASRP